MSYISPPQDQVKALHDRLLWMAVILCGIVALLVVRLWGLQVWYGDYYHQLSEQNRLRHVPIQAPRGLIYDRAGRLLVTNVPSLNLYVVEEDMSDPSATIAEISRTLGLTEDEVRDRINKRRESAYTPVLIKQGLTLSEAARLETHRLSLSGLKIEVEARRRYLYGPMASHLLGYVGEVTAEQLDAAKDDSLSPGAIIGQSGLESSYDHWLRGRDGMKRVEVDALGHERRVVDAVEPVRGDDLYLTIDMELQRVAEEALGDRAGAVVAVDPNSGDVLAMVSHPSVDPNLLSGNMSTAEWTKLVNDSEHPLTNRVIQGVYPPGSVFKIPVAAAALESHQIRPEDHLFCQGGLQFGRRYFHDWKAGGHGDIAMNDAIAQSCDVYFYRLGSEMGVDTIAKYATEFGLGQPTGIALSSERHGIVPSTDWKVKAMGEPWYPGETLSVAIGQGYVGVTPLQMADLIATVASGGRRYQPHLVKAMQDRDSGRLEAFPPTRLADAAVSAKTFRILRTALTAVVEGEHGTGGAARSKLVSIAGKTGTAQVVGSANAGQVKAPTGFEDHAWFVAFAPVESPEIAIAVLVEHGGHGGSAAAPVAKQMIEHYLRPEPSTPGSAPPGEVTDTKPAKKPMRG
ncbi:MAG TPA: penicillin-binding protein 2 [Nitrospiria bacterium]|nr:penicillin-binding protein 2 [Nitrospiria bacterium]